MLTETEIKEKLKEVFDPEIRVNVVDLGLIYEIKADGETVNVKMTLTSPMCPLGPQMMKDVHNKVLELPGVKDANVELVWSPAWDPRTMASEEAKMELGIE